MEMRIPISSSRRDDIDRKVADLDTEQRVDLVKTLYADHFETSLETRYRFFKALSQIPASLAELTISPALRERLEYLNQQGRYTLTRVAVQVIDDLIENDRFDGAHPEVFHDSSQVLFVTPQESFRHNPQMLGVLRTVSFLQFMGIEAHLFDMSFEQDRTQLEERIRKYGENIGFVSMCNLANPLGGEDYDSVFAVYRLLECANGGRPRFAAGGRGAGFNVETLLTNTPLEIIFQRHGSVAFGEMIFDSDYRGPRDTRSNSELFGNIPGIVIKGCSKGTIEEGKYGTASRRTVARRTDRKIEGASYRVVDATLDPSMIDYRMWWRNNISTDICAPYSFNSPKSLANGAKTRTEVHPADLYYQLRMVKLMSSTGSCMRRCKHCHYTSFSSFYYIQPAEVFMRTYDRLMESLPQTEIVCFDDDDFMAERIKQGQLDNFLEALKKHKTRGKVVYTIETVAQEAQDGEALQRLKEAGFRTIILGIENHAEVAVRHTNKLRSHESFEDFIATPKRLVDRGFYTRTSFMVVYPTLKEEEFVTTARGLVDYIDRGVSVIS